MEAKKNKLLIILILLVLAIIVLSVFFVLEDDYSLQYENEVANASRQFNVDEALVFAIIKVESDFDSNAISKKGARGLMQVIPSTMNFVLNESVNADLLFEPRINIFVGVKYLFYLFNKFPDVNMVICAYNAGEGNVDKWLKDSNIYSNGEFKNIPFDETKNYLKKVNKYYDKYKTICKKG